MPKTNEYLGRQSENGVFSCHIKREINFMLDMFCRINGYNKTAYVNKLIEDDMAEKFNKLKEEN